MSEAEKIAETLGGIKVLGTKIRTDDDLIKVSRRGLPYNAVITLAAKTGTPVKAFSYLVVPSWRTMARRAKSRRFAPDESDRALRVARVVARAAEALGSEDKARIWLTRENRALGNKKPLSMLDTDIGVQRVVDVLGRIEEGTFS